MNLRLARPIGSRLLSGLLVLWVTATLAFFALKSMPGDPALSVLSGGNPTPETIREFRHTYGLDQPLGTQYRLYLQHLLHGDLGVSYSQHLPVVRIVAEQIGATVQLTLVSLSGAWLLAVTWTVLTVGGPVWLSNLGSAVQTVCASAPPFWLGIVLLALLAFGLHWFPPAGNDGLRSLVLPALALSIPLAGFIGQITRQSLELVLEQPFILSARTRGLGAWAIRYKHALRHSVLPGVSLSGWALGAQISGGVVVEYIFSRQGLGRQLALAVQLQDLPLALGVTLVVAMVYVLASILVDVVYHLIDPRLRSRVA